MNNENKEISIAFIIYISIYLYKNTHNIKYKYM